MGMKRQGAARKQVLHLESKKKEPQRVTWKSKYVRICADHVTTNGGSENLVTATETAIVAEETTPPVVKVNALHGLSGYLSSDSSSETSDHEADLQGEVNAFLKEIEELTPVVKPSQESVKKVSPPPAEAVAVPVETVAAAPPPMPAPLVLQDPTPPSSTPYSTLPTNSWQECYDSTTGYTYYWNVETNQVTWEMPPEYQNYVLAVKQWQNLQAHNALMQQARLHHQQQQQQVVAMEYDVPQKDVVIDAQPKLTKMNPKSDSEDEKIELITSYGPNSGDESSNEESTPFKPPVGTKRKKSKKERGAGTAFGPQLPADYNCLREEKKSTSLVPYHPEYEDLEAEEVLRNSKLNFVPDTGPPGLEDEVAILPDTSRKKKTKVQETPPPPPEEKKLPQSPKKETSPGEEEEKTVAEDDEMAILDRLRSRSKVLKELGGVIPEEVRDIFREETTAPAKKESDGRLLSLVPGYGEDSEHEEEEAKEDHKEKVVGEVEEENSAVSTFKAELRKPDGAVAGTKRKLKLEVPGAKVAVVGSNTIGAEAGTSGWSMDETAERRGFGFEPPVAADRNAKKPKMEMIQFVKASEVLNPTPPTPPSNEPVKSPEKEETEEKKSEEFEIKDLSELLSDKMKFLSESKPPVSPVQKWAIQLETLVKAWESSELSTSYIRSWLSMTSQELGRLETSVAPPGWLCQWRRYDRCDKPDQIQYHLTEYLPAPPDLVYICLTILQ